MFYWVAEFDCRTAGQVNSFNKNKTIRAAGQTLSVKKTITTAGQIFSIFRIREQDSKADFVFSELADRIEGQLFQTLGKHNRAAGQIFVLRIRAQSS